MTDSPARLAAEIRKLEHKHEEDPEGRYFVPLADAYRQLGELDHAELLLRDGLRRHPEYLGAHVVLGRCLLDRGDAGGAEEEFRQVIARDPQNLVALRALGELAAAAGHPEDAVRWYRELLAVDPLNEEARRALVAIMQPGEGATEGGTEAQDANGEAQAEPPAGPAAVENGTGWEDGEVITETMAELYARQGIYDRAVEVYRELVQRDGQHPVLAQRLREVERLAAAERGGVAEVHALEPAAANGAADGGGPATIAAYLAELLAWTPGVDAANGIAASESAPTPLDAVVAAVAPADDFSAVPARRDGGAVAPRARAAWQAAEPLSRSVAAGHAGESGDLESFQQWLRSLHG